MALVASLIEFENREPARRRRPRDAAREGAVLRREITDIHQRGAFALVARPGMAVAVAAVLAIVIATAIALREAAMPGHGPARMARSMDGAVVIVPLRAMNLPVDLDGLRIGLVGRRKKR